jgi:predicted chitinase
MNNRDIVINELNAAGITNKYSVAAILAVIDKESGFKPQSEISYANTDNDCIRSIFSKTKKLSDQDLNSLKSDPVKFFNLVYGPDANKTTKYGNGPSDGYTYRGRGFNQLTFKGNYKKYGDLIKMDLVTSPDLVNDPKVAAKVVAAYFKETFKNNAKLVKSRYGASNINDFKDEKNAVNAFYNANAGFGKDTSRITTQGKTKALKKVSSFLNITPAKGALISLPLILIGALIYYYSKK